MNTKPHVLKGNAVSLVLRRRKAVSVQGYILLREMADAGDFGGSVPEKKQTLHEPEILVVCHMNDKESYVSFILS
jgi:hypothetical protein